MMKFGNVLIIFLLFSSFSFSVLADETNVATVVMVRGLAKAELPNGKEFEMVEEQVIPEGAKITTSEKSFVKLVFIDKSTINLGPSSTMLIQAFPKKNAGIINLLKGQIRAEVTKNYMEMEDKSKSKLYIHTKTSAMAIRGTDFQVNYNPVNQNSSLIVFEGKVVMAHIERSLQNEEFAQNRLEAIVSANTAVLVRQGQISAVNLKISDRALIPTKLSPTQLDALKENSSGLEEDPNVKKRFRDTVPPGLDSSAFNNASPDVIKAEAEKVKSVFDEKTHEYRPAAGTILDLKTVNIISPPPEAPFDYSTKTFVITENFGKIDGRTGQFKAPAGYEFSHDGQYQPIKNQMRNELKIQGQKRIEKIDSAQPKASPDAKDARGATVAPPVLLPPPPIVAPMPIGKLPVYPVKLPTNQLPLPTNQLPPPPTSLPPPTNLPKL